MRRTGKILAVLAIAGIALLMGGCRKQTELPDVSGLGAITAISREEGSGAGFIHGANSRDIRKNL